MIFDGQLEIDSERGVIYFHSNENGNTLLRIQGLENPIPRPTSGDPLDIRITEAKVSWKATADRFK